MKKIIKAGQFFIFAVAIMGLFAACGESEVFDEPTVYQTRAIRSADTNSESPVILNSGDDTITEVILDLGKDTISGQIVEKKVEATVTLKWYKNYTLSHKDAIESSCEVDCGKTGYKCEKTTRYKIGFQSNHPFAEYSFKLISSKDTVLSRIITFRSEKKISIGVKPEEESTGIE